MGREGDKGVEAKLDNCRDIEETSPVKFCEQLLLSKTALLLRMFLRDDVVEKSVLRFITVTMLSIS